MSPSIRVLLPLDTSLTPLARILLVDDDPSDVALTLATLGDAGLSGQVYAVNDGLQAIEYLHSRGAYEHRAPGHPAVMLLDVKLPKIDGFEVLAQIRADRSTRVLPVVMLTSSSQPGELQRAYELGANGYVVKTIDFAANNAALLAVAQFWALVNEPPPGSLPRVKIASERN